MSERPLKVMIADENEIRGDVLAQALMANGYTVVARAGEGAYLPTFVADAEPDVVLVNTDSPSRDTLEQLSTIRRDQPKPIVMFSSDEELATIKAAVSAGVSAYIVDGMASARVQPIINLAIAHFSEHQSVRDDLQSTKTSLLERKTLDKAKGVIMQRRGCSEPEAFAILRNAAMDQRKRIGQVAQDVLAMASLLDSEQAAERGTPS